MAANPHNWLPCGKSWQLPIDGPSLPGQPLVAAATFVSSLGQRFGRGPENVLAMTKSSRTGEMNILLCAVTIVDCERAREKARGGGGRGERRRRKRSSGRGRGVHSQVLWGVEGAACTYNIWVSFVLFCSVLFFSYLPLPSLPLLLLLPRPMYWVLLSVLTSAWKLKTAKYKLFACLCPTNGA